MGRKSDKGEPVGWVTIKGKHFPKWADGTIGWQDGQEEESKNSNKKKDVRENEYNFKKPVTELRQDMKAMATSGKYKNTDQLKEAYVDYLSKMPASKRNELLRMTGGKGVDRIMAAASNEANTSGLPFGRDKSFKKMHEEYSRLRELAKSNMDQVASKPSSRNARYDTSRSTKSTKPQYLNNGVPIKEQAYMNYKAIRISKNMPKEEQERLRKLKEAYRKDWQGK